MDLRIRLGATCPSIKDQCVAQLGQELIEEIPKVDWEVWQKVSESLIFLTMRGYITQRNSGIAERKLINTIGQAVRDTQAMMEWKYREKTEGEKGGKK